LVNRPYQVITMESKVSFLGIGAAKSGSTWLASLLGQHPQVAFPKLKEAAYFNRFDYDGSINKVADFDLAYYHGLWNNADGKLIGEWSPQYFYDLEAAQRIAKYNPDMKLLLVLRNPVNRAHSHFIYDQNFNELIDPNLSFSDACKEHDYLLNAGLYAKQLQRFLKIFKREQIAIFVLEEITLNPDKTAKQLYDFLEIDSTFIPDFAPKNESKRIKNKRFNWILSIPGKLKRKMEQNERYAKKLQRFEQSDIHQKLFYWKTKLKDINVSQIEKSVVQKEAYNELLTFFDEDIRELNKLGVNTSYWKPKA
jgi:hypothetical protein